MADPRYGCEVGPNPPQQDMTAIDHIAGGGAQTRDGDPAAFTGGTGGKGLGGQAIPPEAGSDHYERIGF